MGQEHVQALLCVAVFLFALGFYALKIPQGGPAFRAVQRIFWGFFGVWLCAQGDWMGLNAVTLCLSAGFGLPGIGAALFLTQM